MLRRWELWMIGAIATCAACVAVLIQWSVLATLVPVAMAKSGPELAFKRHGYPYPAARDCDEDLTRTCDRDMWGLLQGQCTSWVAFRVNQRNHVPLGMDFTGRHWGDARNWGRVAREAGMRVDTMPSAGAIAWYADNHVAYVERVNSPTSVVISEMNYDGHNGFRERTITPGDGWPSGFIHVGENAVPGQQGAVRA